MSRTFEIYDRRGSRRFSDDDLPLSIGSAEDVHIRLDSGTDIRGFIGDSRGHLFLQPASASPSVALYHNDRQISASVWIKSGDITRSESNLIQYGIAGDRVEIRVTAAADKSIVPPAAPEPLSANAGGEFSDILPQEPEQKKRRHARLARIIAFVFPLLLAAVFFVLAAKPLAIKISPPPDSLAVKGFPPVIRIGQHFLGLSGEYVLRAEKDGFKPLATRVVIAPESGASSYTYTLEKLPGKVSFFTQPAAAEVLVNGHSLGNTPLTNEEIPAGAHTLRIVKERYEDAEQNITVEGMGRKQRFDLALTPSWSSVTLTSDPPGAEVVINGRTQGTTPLTLDLLQGDHRIIFQKEEYAPLETELTVPAGKNLSPAAAVLTPAPATLEIAGSPRGASLLIDSVFHGQTPLTVTLSSRKEHTLALSLLGYGTFRQRITLAPGENRKLSPELSPESGSVYLATEPPDAELFIDGKHTGKATGRIKLTLRQHTLEIKAAGYKTETRTVRPAKEYPRHLEVRLEPEQTAGNAGVRIEKQTTAGGREMILLPPAAFAMGSSGREPGRRANEHLHQVKITRPFYLSAREVTNGEFRRFKPDHSSGAIAGFSLDGEHQPVVNVSWEDAVRYLNWLSRQDGLDPFYREENGRFVPEQPLTAGYRLPFEAEWAYAARYAGRTNPARYPWSGTFPPPAKSGNYADESARAILPIIIRGYADTFPVTAPVAGFPGEPGGFFDIGGNVSEWCHDFYTPYIRLTTGITEDPMGPEAGVHHVVRGASWRDGSVTELRLTYRSYSNQALDDTGFRIARFAR